MLEKIPKVEFIKDLEWNYEDASCKAPEETIQWDRTSRTLIKHMSEIPKEEWINYFISEYNKGNKIEEALIQWGCGRKMIPFKDDELVPLDMIINQDNTINIFIQEEEEKMYSGDEVIKLINKAIDDTMNNSSYITSSLKITKK
jgi:hypothetical protein